ncbi:MAG: hypothetical protein ACFB6S_15975 [Geminicoccaceae bacterium]
MRTVITVDSHDSAKGTLRALSHLKHIDQKILFHEKYNRRHPLAVYSISIGRICGKIKKTTEKLEKLWISSSNIEKMMENGDIIDEIIDYLELNFYSAAEHVDDIKHIVSSLFKTKESCITSKKYKKFVADLKPLRDEIASFANTIKHNHGRVRPYMLQFLHCGKNIVLIGFFIEGVNENKLCPCPVLHSKKRIISVTSFLWSIIVYVWQTSNLTAKFIEEIGGVDSDEVSLIPAPAFCDAVLSLSRLPLYSFDDTHPFATTTVLPRFGESRELDQNQVYGSFGNPWQKSDDGEFKGDFLMYGGDGVSNEFELVRPERWEIRHWE